MLDIVKKDFFKSLHAVLVIFFLLRLSKVIICHQMFQTR